MARDDDDDRDRDEDDEDDDERSKRKKKKKGASAEEKQMAMFCHLGTLIGGFLVPLIIWMTKKETSRYIDKHGKEAINFSISALIWYMVIVLPTCGLGAFVLMPLFIWWTIAASMEANKGGFYRYPMTIRFIK